MEHLLMQFTDIFIRKPVFSTVLTLILLLVGIRAYTSLPTRQYPEVAISEITVQTTYPGASSELMEGFVTTPIENALSGINGIDFITSTSAMGSSAININFKLGTDINKAVTDVSNAIASVRYVLPSAINDPIVATNDPNARPIIYIPFISDTFSAEQITDYLVRAVQPQIATLPGVAKAVIYGERLYSMRIWLNPQEMAARGVTAPDIMNALTVNNIQAAAGRIASQWNEFNVTAKTDLSTPEQFNDLVIKNNNGLFVRLKDVGRANLGPAGDRVSFNINGKGAMVMAIIAQPSANPLDISKEINRVFPSIQQFLPAGLKGQIIWDSSKFIAQSIKEVYRTIIEATVFVIIVIFLFLGSLRNATIPIVTIPLSIIGVCSIMLAMGYSINILTLLAWVLAVGLVVDDAIVVLENIHRHVENGLTPFDASIKGAREIAFPVIAMTLTLAAVYAPIGFVSGLTGALFREFAFTLAGTVIISGFVALTLSPMLCSKLLKHSEKGGFAQKVDAIFNRFMNFYQRLLEKTLANRLIVVLITLLIFASCYFLYITLPSELAPEEDQGVVMSAFTGPSNANLAYTVNQSRKLEKAFSELPEQLGFGVINGFGGSGMAVNSGFAFLVLKPWEERKRSAAQIIASLFSQFWAIPGLRAFPFNPPSLPGASGFTPVSFVLKTTGSYADLNAAIKKLTAVVQKENPRLLNIDSDLKLDSSQINIDFDRNKASDLGISMNDISTTLNVALSQPSVSRFSMNGRSYDVIPQILPQFQYSAQQLNNLQVRAANGQLIPLSSIAVIRNSVQPQSLNHFQQIRSATITASLAPGYTLGEALSYLQIAAKKNLPANIQYDFSGQSRQLIEASGAMEETFIFAILFIFLILAAQFESFRNPLIVMMSVPLSTAGALLSLHLLPGGTLNIYTQIGLVTLVGLISKHGILIVEFADQLQREGRDKLTAIIESSAIRLRPVIMTTFAMVLGALPLALSSGAGSGARSQLGWVIVGGMSFGTLFTLFVIPTAYLYMASVKKSHSSLETDVTNK
jgi:hydrophobe/amphiphile efflux-1 (HAE1) family protein